jgi:hypothetical protein
MWGDGRTEGQTDRQIDRFEEVDSLFSTFGNAPESDRSHICVVTKDYKMLDLSFQYEAF